MGQLSSAEDICNLAMTLLGAEAVANVSASSASTAEEIACERVYAHERDMLLAIPHHNWSFAKKSIQLNPADGYQTSLFDQVDITGISQADPAVVTATAHGFLDDWLVRITGVSGMTEINNRIVRVTGAGSDTFSCLGLNSTKYTAYTSGGKAERFEAKGEYQEGYMYDIPFDFLKPIHMENRSTKWEIVPGNVGRILTDTDDSILHYIASVSVTVFSNAFNDALAHKIAYTLSPTLSKKGLTTKELYELYQLALEDAIALDGKRWSLTNLVKDDCRIKDAGGWT
jgi:hypothetical protein